AREDFEARVVESLKSDAWHLAAHIYGAALFAEFGEEALAHCGQQYAFGCLHEVFERIVAESSVNRLMRAVQHCESALGGWHPCHHGLGHGLVSYFGHTE